MSSPISILPDKPSTLIRLALSDLASCEADPQYKVVSIDVYWHIPCEGYTEVGLIGAVMARSLKVPPSEPCYPSTVESILDHHKLRALVLFSQGRIASGCSELFIAVPQLRSKPIPQDRGISWHAERPAAFVEDMERLAQDFSRVTET